MYTDLLHLPPNPPAAVVLLKDVQEVPDLEADRQQMVLLEKKSLHSRFKCSISSLFVFSKRPGILSFIIIIIMLGK
jgi:hypothetical protein